MPYRIIQEFCVLLKICWWANWPFVGIILTVWAGMSRTHSFFSAANFLSTIRMRHLVFTETMLLMFHNDLVCLRINSFQQTAFGTFLHESCWEPCSSHCQGLSVMGSKNEVRQYIFDTPAPQPVRNRSSNSKSARIASCYRLQNSCQANVFI